MIACAVTCFFFVVVVVVVVFWLLKIFADETE